MPESELVRLDHGGVRRRHPEWIRVRAPFGQEVHDLKKLLLQLKLHTVCQEAICPNMGECWSHRVATFMILGDICTRGCRYCAVGKGKPPALDPDEPENLAKAAAAMELRHAVITSVNRDDLADGGASVFAAVTREIRKLRAACKVELLIPDFQGDEQAVQIVLDARPDIVGHNIETVPRLYRTARGGGVYDVSLAVLRQIASYGEGVVPKTGLMLGLGETDEEILQVMRDVHACGVKLLTLGQYLRPSSWHLPVARYYHPEEFKQWKRIGEDIGFIHVESGPLVRSSYLADRQFTDYAEAAENQ